MSNIFAFGRKKDTKEKDYFSSVIYSSTLPPKITEENALQIPTVKSAIELISNSVSQLQINLFKKFDDKDIEKVIDPRLHLLNVNPNNFMYSSAFLKELIEDYLLYGKAYIYQKEDGTLHYLSANSIEEVLYTDDEGLSISKRSYIYSAMTEVELSDEEVIVIDSGTNGILSDSSDVLLSAYHLQQYNAALLQNGALPTGVLKATSRLTKDAIIRLRESWESLYSGPRKAGKTMILEEGLDYRSLSLNPNEMQMVDLSKLLTSEIARVFNIPESMLNSSANKYNSLEQNSIQFYQNTIAPILSAIENAFNKNLLTEAEQLDNLYFEFDSSSIVRMTEKEKIENVGKALSEGLISFNEARARLNHNKSDNDYYKFNLGSVIQNSDGTWTIPNMGIVENKQIIEGGKPINEDRITDEPSITELG